ncbi:hypothetical protein CWATWH0402_4261 [Crocosphaera watsonii WH 0402]|uniref:Uncharacterized protein n=2 Tax=Crocosphaera watsonii TaxID=263511 RepID=T2JTB9_CROWT|nr:hypothetical protein CWATWH0005_5600 [Crocosphaera watsonii WH 0005]CCQ68450.1 hypothetical protein CWATWH0402_4261 [Crocosphaera watsonii WH 0402]
MIDIVEADLSLSAHAEAMIQLMDHYARLSNGWWSRSSR